MNNIYFKIIKCLTKQEYELKARYIPALIFTISLIIMIYIKYLTQLDLGWVDTLKIPLIIFSSLFFALIPKFCSTIISGYLQTVYWNKFGNTTINYIKKNDKQAYKELLIKFNTDEELLLNMKKITRKNRLLLSKNIFYGFMRNLSFLAFCLLVINLIYFNYFIFENILLILFLFLCLYISSQRYAEQIIDSYLELKE